MGGPKSNWGKKISFLAVFSLLLIQITPSFAQDYYRAKSENAAAAWSFFGTAVPIGTGIWIGSKFENTGGLTAGLISGGILVGPSLGYFYAGLHKRGLIGVGVRTFIVGSTIVAEEIRDKKRDCGWEGCRPEGPSAIVVLGTGALFVAALVDMFWVTEAVKKRNQKILHGHFTLSPAYLPQHQAPGLQLQIVF